MLLKQQDGTFPKKIGEILDNNVILRIHLGWKILDFKNLNIQDHSKATIKNKRPTLKPDTGRYINKASCEQYLHRIL
jgi:hypothetical protein